jgi:hypothetical protein
MININSPRGLGDALHLRAIVIHLLETGKEVSVFTQWPDVFSDLDVAVQPAEEAVNRPDLFSARACFQCQLPYVRALSQFRNACLQAGVFDAIELNIRWTVRNQTLLDKVKSKAAGKPILIYQPLKRVKNASDGLLRPDRSALRKIVNDRSEFFRVRIGHPDYAEDDEIERDLDLFGKTTVSDVIDLASICEMTVSEPSFVSVLAQCFDKRFVCLFSSLALQSAVKKVAGVTPQRILEKPHLATVVYD